jgi:hypothetical protein
VTVLYLGSKVPLDAICKVIPPVFEAVSKTKPFSVSTNRLSVFPPHPKEGTVPLICPIDSSELHALRKSICDACDAAGVEYSKTFKDYTPHVTLAYSKDPLVHADWGPDHPITPLSWGAHELVLWGGDDGDKRIVVTFPFSMAMSKEGMDRAFVQLAQRWSRFNVLDVSTLPR